MSNFSRDGSLAVQILPPYIQQEVASLQSEIGMMQARWPNTILFNDTRKRMSMYDCYPHLFLGAFPKLTNIDVRPLNVAARLFATSIFIGDKLIDEATGSDSAAYMTLSIHALQIEAIHLLNRILPVDSPFWDQLKKYTTEYIEACFTERSFINGRKPWSEYTEPLAMQIAIGKSGVSRAVIAAMADLAKDDSLLEPLLQSVDQYNIACQLLDDISDWREDLNDGRPSLVTVLALKEKPALQALKDRDAWMGALARKIHYGGYTTHVIQLASIALEKADQAVAHIPNLLWRDAVAHLQNRCQALLHDLNQIISRNLAHKKERNLTAILLPQAKGPWTKLALDSANYILKQWHLGYGEARNIMRFAKYEGFSADSEYHYADIFQRALFTDTLLDFDAQFGSHLTPVIESEIKYLVDNRCKDGLGGWSYFPSLPELPPDADDLAQIMQVLVRSGHTQETIDLCEVPLACLLTDNAHDDGSFETWILPTNGRTPKQELQYQWVQKAWGTGADCDVMANLLYGINLYNPERFHDVIERGVGYLEAQQNLDGSWSSTWYHGPYYGTYVCLRAIAAIKPSSPSIQKAFNFFAQNQQTDGGWGHELKSDSLSTALALLGLVSVHKCQTNHFDQTLISQALSFLQNSAQNDGSWPNCEFIRMPVGRPTGIVTNVISYGSRTLTTSFVLKAALAWGALEKINQKDPVSSTLMPPTLESGGSNFFARFIKRREKAPVG